MANNSAMNIIEGLQEEIVRVREIAEIYEGLPSNSGVFAALMVRQSIRNAEYLIAVGDTIGMIKAYNELKGYEL